MKTFVNMAAQGDLLLIRKDSLPDKLKKCRPNDRLFVVAHSETGHHHVIEDTGNVCLYEVEDDPFLWYLVVEEAEAYLRHERPFDTHESLVISPGIYEVRRQREYAPEGFRRVMD